MAVSTAEISRTSLDIAYDVVMHREYARVNYLLAFMLGKTDEECEDALFHLEEIGTDAETMIMFKRDFVPCPCNDERSVLNTYYALCGLSMNPKKYMVKFFLEYNEDKDKFEIPPYEWCDSKIPKM